MKQEIYVKEMPDICDECPFHNEENDKCILLPQYNIRPFLQSCPLHDLQKHNKELVEKVCDKVRKWCKNIREWTYDSSHRVLDLHNLDEFLKQIQKEFEDE